MTTLAVVPCGYDLRRLNNNGMELPSLIDESEKIWKKKEKSWVMWQWLLHVPRQASSKGCDGSTEGLHMALTQVKLWIYK